MTSSELNSAIRYLIEEAINSGAKKYHICSLTLGSQSQPQLDIFLKGNDLGFKPLSRIISSFGYELHLVPVPKKDDLGEINRSVENICDDFLLKAEDIFKNALKNIPDSGYIIDNEIVKKLTDKIISDINSNINNK